MAKGNGKETFMEKIARFIVDKRNIVFFVFAVLALFCAFSRNWVKVNDDITAYLPESTETRQGLELMAQEFTTFGTADIMVENITYEQAVDINKIIEKTDGVKSVAFDETSAHYAQASALFSVTFDGTDEDQVSIDSLNAIKEELSEYDLYVDSDVGNPLKAIIDQEMLLVDAIALVIIVVVLLLTSQSYAEIPVLLITFGAAALLNMGTNYLMGEVSFVTNAVAIVLQLALAIDYAIILCHRFSEERADKEAREAAIVALSKAIPEISASSLTTISGLVALCLMQFKLGYDMGIVLIKAIVLSLLSVFLLMPGLLVMFSDWIDKSKHKSFIPKINLLGKAVYATRYVMPVIFIAVLITAFSLSRRVNYVYSNYSVSSIRQNEAQIAAKNIKDVFGSENQLAIIVPSGDYKKEAKLIADVEELSGTNSVLGLANVEAMDGYVLTDSLTPRKFAELTNLDYEVAEVLYAGYAINVGDSGQAATNLENYSVPLIDMFEYLCQARTEVTVELDPDTEELMDTLEPQLKDAKLQLKSEDWSRIVIESNVPIEGDESYKYLDMLHGICARYYDDFYVVGDTTSCSDLKASFEHDNLMISIMTIVFVIAVLLFTFQSVGMPVLLVLVIQGAIWCNFSIPFIKGSNLFFLTYLIISSIQMGANIDYAIVISTRYMQLKNEMPLKEAMIETLNHAFPTIITSGTMMISAGIAIGLLTSNETISAIGIYLATGTSISVVLVMCVLPQILLLGDILIEKTSFNIKINRGVKYTKTTNLVKINGRIRGNLNGYIDAEVHGVFRGELNAVIDIGNIESDSLLPPGEDEEDENNEK